jgi:hypothetical protein
MNSHQNPGFHLPRSVRKPGRLAITMVMKLCVMILKVLQMKPLLDF